jgi:hypothetical protein
MHMLGFLENLPPTILFASLAGIVLIEIILCVLVAMLFSENRSLKQKLAVFFSGKEAKDLEKVLLEQLTETKALDQEIQELFEISNRLRELGLKSIHKTSVLRFNPFKEVGSNQSFCVALLDGKNCGMVFSSLHTREGTRVYAKPVQNGETDGFPFTEEERQAIEQAIHGKKGPVI